VPGSKFLSRGLDTLLNVAGGTTYPNGNAGMLDPAARIDELTANCTDASPNGIFNKNPKPVIMERLDVVVQKAEQLAVRHSGRPVVQPGKIKVSVIAQNDEATIALNSPQQFQRRRVMAAIINDNDLKLSRIVDCANSFDTG
jgi:hypothetical protein